MSVSDLIVEGNAAVQMRLRSLDDAHDLIRRLTKALQGAATPAASVEPSMVVQGGSNIAQVIEALRKAGYVVAPAERTD